VAHLPDWHPDVDGVPDPKWRRRGKRMVLDLGLRGGSTVARGNAIREQVLAQQHLPNPITIILPDGTTTRVWLATGKDGKKIIGDALEWGINCAGRTETPLEVVNSRETAPGDHDTPGARPNSCCPFGPTPGALQGDDVQPPGASLSSGVFALSRALQAGLPGSVAPARLGYGPRKPYQALVMSASSTSLQLSETWACLSRLNGLIPTREPSAPTPTTG
jgi:hypothetical protein